MGRMFHVILNIIWCVLCTALSAQAMPGSAGPHCGMFAVTVRANGNAAVKLKKQKPSLGAFMPKQRSKPPEFSSSVGRFFFFVFGYCLCFNFQLQNEIHEFEMGIIVGMCVNADACGHTYERRERERTMCSVKIYVYETADRRRAQHVRE